MRRIMYVCLAVCSVVATVSAVAQDGILTDGRQAGTPTGGGGLGSPVESDEARKSPPQPIGISADSLSSPGRPDGVWVPVEGGRALIYSQTLDLALKNNPEIEAARLELQAAEARLKQLELQTARDLARKQHEISTLTVQLEALESKVATGDATPESVVSLKAELDAREQDLLYISGVTLGSMFESSPTFQFLSEPPVVSRTAVKAVALDPDRPHLRDATPDGLLQKLDATMDISFIDASLLTEALEHISQSSGINFVKDVNLLDTDIDLVFQATTVRNVLLAITDAYDVVFVVRDYGLFVATPQRARTISGPTIPEGVPYVDSAERSNMSGLGTRSQGGLNWGLNGGFGGAIGQPTPGPNSRGGGGAGRRN